jgi:hypothetical protein
VEGEITEQRRMGVLGNKFIILNLLLADEQRRKFILRQYPTFIIYVAILSFGMSLISFGWAVFPWFLARPYATALSTFLGVEMEIADNSIILFSFMMWNICVGALGSIAFISVNALSMQSDATFDITNARFVMLRVVLGALFGVLIALPIGIEAFATLCGRIAELKVADLVSGKASPEINSTVSALYRLLAVSGGWDNV